MSEENEIFIKGDKIDSEFFSGNTWLGRLVEDDIIFNCPITNVTFEPRARNNWHTHAGGQILLVTAGEGYFQEEGQPVQYIKPGDVIKIKPDVKHWHGATSSSYLIHLAITTNPERGTIKWFEPVTDEEYSKL